MICGKAVVPWIALWWVVKPAAPSNRVAAGAMVGAAAMLFSFAIMRLDCSLDGPIALVRWHLEPVLVVTIVSVLAGARGLRRRGFDLMLGRRYFYSEALAQSPLDCEIFMHKDRSFCGLGRIAPAAIRNSPR
jgi:hypothetical protein